MRKNRNEIIFKTLNSRKMKKILILTLVTFSLTSCTYQEVLAYLSGKDVNTSTNQSVDNTARMSTDNSLLIEEDIDRGNGRPKLN